MLGGGAPSIVKMRFFLGGGGGGPGNLENPLATPLYDRLTYYRPRPTFSDK